MIASAASLEPQVTGLSAISFGAREDANECLEDIEEEFINAYIEEEACGSVTEDFAESDTNQEETLPQQSIKYSAEKEKISLIKSEIEEDKSFHSKMLNILNDIKETQERLTQVVTSLCDIEKQKLILQNKNYEEEKRLKHRDLQLRASELEIARTANELKEIELSK